VHNFIADDLSSFYLDFAKDILYIEEKNNHYRRSIQTGYYDILVTLVKLLTPIIPHTMDEVWEYIPGTEAETVQLTDMPRSRDNVLKALEEARDAKVIGKSLESKVTIVPKDKQTKEVLDSISNLHQLLIVSEADVKEEEKAKEYQHVSVYVEKHAGETCERCWVSSHTVGENKEHPTLCTRCADVVTEHYTE